MLGLVQLRRFSSPPKVEAVGLEGEIPDCVMDQIWITKFAHVLQGRLWVFLEILWNHQQLDLAFHSNLSFSHVLHPFKFHLRQTKKKLADVASTPVGYTLAMVTIRHNSNNLRTRGFMDHGSKIIETRFQFSLRHCWQTSSGTTPETRTDQIWHDMTWAPNTLPVILVRITIIGGSPKVLHQGDRISIPWFCYLWGELQGTSWVLNQCDSSHTAKINWDGFTLLQLCHHRTSHHLLLGVSPYKSLALRWGMIYLGTIFSTHYITTYIMAH